MKVIKMSKHSIAILVTILAVTYAGFALGEVSPEEAAHLGKNLTQFGAEKSGNADGGIPEYTRRPDQGPGQL